MKNKLIEFETAKLAKEKGFDVSVYDFYHVDGGYKEKWSERRNSNISQYYCSAPTQSLVQGWLREKHDIHVYCTPSLHFIDKNFDHYGFSYLHETTLWDDDGSYEKYEQALEAGLVYALNKIE